jgi:DNA-directed RNA polymerase specialized sigma subunit
MTNAEKFQEIFKKFATEVWAFPEKDFLTWLNAEYKEPATKNDLVPRNVVERIIKSPRTKEQMLLVLNSLPSQEPITKVEAIPKADYEQRLKADMVAMLTEIQLEIEEKFNDRPFSYNHHQRTEFYRDIDEVIQQKINSLKEA